MFSTIKHIVSERLSSSNWWNAIACAVLSFLCARFRLLTASAYFLDKARASYREFFISRKTRLIEKLASVEGVHKFMAVVASPNQHTGVEETQVIWTRAESAAKAAQNILAGGRLLRIVTMNGDAGNSSSATAKRTFASVLEDVAKPWVVSHVKKSPPIAEAYREEPPTAILPRKPAPSVLTAILEGDKKLKPVAPTETAPGNYLPDAGIEASFPPLPAKQLWVGHSRNCAISFRKSGLAEVHTEIVKIPVEKGEEPLVRAAKAIAELRSRKPHLQEISLVPVAMMTLDMAPGDPTQYASFKMTPDHVFKGEWCEAPR
jgi:hypothetical protein